MTHAETCPICKGTGRVTQFGGNDSITCTGCNGMGWVTVLDYNDGHTQAISEPSDE